MIRYIALFLLLCVFWATLSGHIFWPEDAYLMICGVVSCLLTTLLVARIGFLEKEGNLGRVFFRQITYLPWLLWQIVLSNWDVAKRVWRLKPDIDPALGWTPYTMKSELVTAIYANSITLTPGTVTVLIDTEKKQMLIHSISPGGISGLGGMHDKVKALEGNDP